MAQLVIAILDDLQTLPKLLAGWRGLGVPGATILESVGAYRAESWLSRAGLGALGHLFEEEEVRRRTVLAAIDDELVGPAVAEAERVVGGFNRPNSGLLLVIPVTQVLGLVKSGGAPQAERETAAHEAARTAMQGTTVLAASAVLRTEPAPVTEEMPLAAVIRTLLEHPNTDVASVVAADGRLVGLVDAPALADSAFVHVFPEDYLSQISDLEEVREFADRTQARLVRDIMRPPVAVTPEDSVREAFRRMHAEGLSGLPIVDEEYRVIGYVTMLELLAMLAAEEGNAPDQKDAGA